MQDAKLRQHLPTSEGGEQNQAIYFKQDFLKLVPAVAVYVAP